MNIENIILNEVIRIDVYFQFLNHHTNVKSTRLIMDVNIIFKNLLLNNTILDKMAQRCTVYVDGSLWHDAVKLTGTDKPDLNNH